MTAAGRIALATLACLGVAAGPARADQVTYEDVDGIRYQVTRRTVQVPVTEMRSQQQTVYRQQVTTDTVQHQQLYSVPVTQYQLVSELHGRWNPFVTPYWTHRYEPVTTWQQQTATVQIPVNRVAWAPETRTVQLPTTTYRTAEAIVSRIPVSASPAAGGAQTMMAGSGAAATGTPSATLAARPSAPPSTPPAAYGGVAMPSDPPKQATGWQTPAGDSRYR